jgi:hypothetical protein
MNLIEKYKQNQFRLLLFTLEQQGIEKEIFDKVLFIINNGETYFEGKSWIGIMQNSNGEKSSFEIENVNTFKKFKVQDKNGIIALSFYNEGDYFYKEIEKTQSEQKVLKDQNVIKTNISNKSKKIFQEGIELEHFLEMSKSCAICNEKNREFLLAGENVTRTKLALRFSPEKILLFEKIDSEGKIKRRVTMIEDNSILNTDLALLTGGEELEMDVDSFEQYINKNREAFSSIKDEKKYQKFKKKGETR